MQFSPHWGTSERQLAGESVPQSEARKWWIAPSVLGVSQGVWGKLREMEPAALQAWSVPAAKIFLSIWAPNLACGQELWGRLSSASQVGGGAQAAVEQLLLGDRGGQDASWSPPCESNW